MTASMTLRYITKHSHGGIFGGMESAHTPTRTNQVLVLVLGPVPVLVVNPIRVSLWSTKDTIMVYGKNTILSTTQ